MIYLFVGLVVCVGMILFFIRYAYKKKLKKYYDDLLSERNYKLEKEICERRSKLQSELEMERIQRESEFNNEKNQMNSELAQLRAQISSQTSSLRFMEQQAQQAKQQAQTYETTLRERADKSVSEYEASMRQKVEENVAVLNKAAIEKMNQELTQKEAEAAEQFLSKVESYEEALKVYETSLNEIKSQIEDYTLKQNSINEAILRQRELDEKQDFYRVCLTEESISDIKLLQQVRQNLKKPEIIDKIIYDNYVAKPVLEMIKRVLSNQTYSGIYKITCLKTNEVYIGKSTDIKSRWQQHCKSAFNCGTIATSLLHTKMKQYGIENFTFELLEKTSKDQLSEREKFYINFYKTKEVGLNERNG